MKLAVLLFLAAPLAAQDSTPTLTLTAAVRQALAQSPTLQAARSRTAAADAQVGESLARRWPQLAMQAAATRFQKPMIVAPLHTFNLTQPPAFDRTLLQGNISLQYTLFDGGARGGQVNGARAQAAAARAETDATELSVIADVARRYLAVLSAGGVLSAQQRGVAALSAESLRVAQVFAEGRAAWVQVLQVQAALANARADLAVARERLTTAELSLARRLEVDPVDTRHDRLRPVGRAAAPTEDREALLVRVEQVNPQLGAARERAEAARRARQSAVARWFPQVDLVGSYLGFAGGSESPIAEWQAGVRLSYPLFAGGSRSSAVRRAGAQADAAEAQYLATERDLADAVDQALAATREARARVEAGVAATQYLDEVARIEQLRVTTGSGTETDYLRAEADARRAAAQLVAVRNAEIASRIELARLSGDLSIEWLANAVENPQ